MHPWRQLAISWLWTCTWYASAAAQTGAWHRVATYGWRDMSTANRQLTAREQELGGGAFASINGIAETEDGRIWALDMMNRKILVFTADGALDRVLGGDGEGPGEFRRPMGLHAGTNGNVYVWDRALSRLTSFDSSGAVGSTMKVARSGLLDFTVAGDTVWFVRTLLSPAYAVVGVLLRSGEVVDSFARLTPSEVSIAAFGSPGRVARFGSGEPVYVGPRPVQLRIRGSASESVRGTDHYPSAKGRQLKRGTRISPVAIRGADVNRQGEIAILYSSTDLSGDGEQGETAYFIEIMNAGGSSLGRSKIEAPSAHGIAWTKNGDLLVGVTDEVPLVWRLRKQ